MATADFLAVIAALFVTAAQADTQGCAHGCAPSVRVAQANLVADPLGGGPFSGGALPRESSGWRPGDSAGAAGPALPKETEETTVVQPISPQPIRETLLAPADPDAAGTISPRRLGLPDTLWSGLSPDDIVALTHRSVPRLPALRGLEVSLWLTQLTPPPRASGEAAGRLLLARIDRLIEMGAIAEAEALIDVAGPPDAERFARHLDLALLDGDAVSVCAMLNARPGLSPGLPAQIYCLTQGGDWSAAATLFYGADALGRLPRDLAPLLVQYLDDSLVDLGEDVAPPEPMSPLAFKMLEAIGQPIPTRGLPLAYAWAELQPGNGWKARIDAAERLARAGALGGLDLARIYEEERSAVSGGVWDRAAAWQGLRQALRNRERSEQSDEDAANALAVALDRFASADLGPALISMLHPADLEGRSDPTAVLLSRLTRLEAGDAVARPSAGAGGDAPPALPAVLPDILADALDAPAPPRPKTQAGQALLAAIDDVDAGRDGDMPRAARGLAALRAQGLDNIAYRAAAQLAAWPILTRTGRLR